MRIKHIIREEVQKMLKEEMFEDRLEEVLKRLNKNVEPPMNLLSGHPVPENYDLISWELGYQRALKDVAEELLGYIF